MTVALWRTAATLPHCDQEGEPTMTITLDHEMVLLLILIAIAYAQQRVK